MLDLAELRAMLTEYFAKYHPFRLTAVAKKGGVLPPHTMRLYGDAPRTLSLLLSELNRLTAELAAAQAERDSLHTTAESRLMRMRTASQLLIAEIGAKGPENVDITAGRAVAVIEGLKEEAARRGPVVEWRKEKDWEEAEIGRFSLAVSDAGWSVEIKGHSGMYELIDRGPETGPAGKAAAEAAYLKAVGLA